MHDVPTTGTEPELDGRGVDDDSVAETNWSGQLGQDIRAFRSFAEIDFDALEARAFLEDALDLALTKRRHGIAR